MPSNQRPNWLLADKSLSLSQAGLDCQFEREAHPQDNHKPDLIAFHPSSESVTIMDFNSRMESAEDTISNYVPLQRHCMCSARAA